MLQLLAVSRVETGDVFESADEFLFVVSIQNDIRAKDGSVDRGTGELDIDTATQ